MPSSLAQCLRSLNLPLGAPTEGQVAWEGHDLFGQVSAATVSWTESQLFLRGVVAGANWSLEFRPTGTAWEAVRWEGEVKGGTSLAKLRWARSQIEAIPANPQPSWVVAQGNRRRDRRGP